MESKKRGSRKTNSSKSKRTTKKRTRLFKTKQIKPKVKLDSNKVLWLFVIIVISCVLLLLATIFIPEASIRSEIIQQTPVEKTNPVEKKIPPKEKKPVTQKPENKTDNSTQEKADKAKKEQEEQNKLEQQRRKEEDALKQKEKEQEEKRLAEEKRKAEEKAKLEEQKKQQEKNKKVISLDFPKAVNNAQIVFLLDDGGQSLSQVEKFTALQMPLTIAVLPKLAHSKETAQKVRGSGKELMLHQPMQALNTATNPGPGAIKPEMTDSEIRSLLAQNFDEVGPIAGFNNHEGSAITADAHKMEVIMKYASDNGVFFLDSRTNKDTQVPYVCKALGYSYYERNGLFLDNKLTQAEKDQGLTMRTKAIDLIRKNVDKANKEGVVIMIGHVWSADWLPQVLSDVYPELKAKGYTVTTVSKCKGKK